LILLYGRLPFYVKATNREAVDTLIMQQGQDKKNIPVLLFTGSFPG